MSSSSFSSSSTSSSSSSSSSSSTVLSLPILPPPLSIDEQGYAKYKLYRHVSFLGKGAFADVNLFIDTVHGNREVAIKSIKKQEYRKGINLGAIKELQIIQELKNHPNIIQLHDVFAYDNRIHMVLEYCITDLNIIIRNTSIFLNEAAIKGYLYQICQGLFYCHQQCRILHRDMKPENVLITTKGIVKLADFGHATRFPDEDTATFPRVITLWYRPPELLMGARYVSPSIDIWSFGCIMAELYLRQPLFACQPSRPEYEEREQLSTIIRLLGTPIDPWIDYATALPAWIQAGYGGEDTLQQYMRMDKDYRDYKVSDGEGSLIQSNGDNNTYHRNSHTRTTTIVDEMIIEREQSVFAKQVEENNSSVKNITTAPPYIPTPSNIAHCPVWLGCSSLPKHAEYETRKPQPWRNIFPLGVMSDTAIDLVSKCLVYDPVQRITIQEILEHPYFTSEPLPLPANKLPLPPLKSRTVGGVTNQ